MLSIVPLGTEHSGMMQHVQFASSYLGLDIEKDTEPNENRRLYTGTNRCDGPTGNAIKNFDQRRRAG